jgi:hypothetical protein
LNSFTPLDRLHRLDLVGLADPEQEQRGVQMGDLAQLPFEFAAGWLKIERWHRSLKNQTLLENYYLPGELERLIAHFVSYQSPRCV